MRRSLLTPDVFNRIAAPEGDAETRRGYGIPEGLDLRDEIARAYRMAEAHWTGFDAAKDGDLSLPARFVPQFLAAVFGFDDLGPLAPVRMGEREFPIGPDGPQFSRGAEQLPCRAILTGLA